MAAARGAAATARPSSSPRDGGSSAYPLLPNATRRAGLFVTKSSIPGLDERGVFTQYDIPPGYYGKFGYITAEMLGRAPPPHTPCAPY